MKKIIILIFIAFGLFSCEGRDKSFNNELSKYDKIGEDHNTGLDYILFKLEKDNSLVDLHSFINPIKKYSNEFVENTFSSVRINPVNFSEIYSQYDRSQYRMIKKKSSKSNLFNIADVKKMTESQIIYLTKLDNILSNFNGELQPTIIAIEKIENDIFYNVSKNEREYLLVATAVAKSSLRYWFLNAERWHNSLTEILSKNDKNFVHKKRSWGWLGETLLRMAKTDVGGALVGLVVAGLPGAVAGGCYSSAAKGVDELL